MVSVRTASRTGDRVSRSPIHTFQIRARPFQIQPFLIAPVLPAETLKNALLQARVVTDPIKNPLIGWWQEYYLFYVKHRDLDERDTLTAMMLDPTLNAESLEVVEGKAALYTSNDRVDWVTPCLKRVVEEYFRDEGEEWDDYMIGDLPAIGINGNSWLDSLTATADIPVSDPSGTTGTTESVIDQQRLMWEAMRAQMLTDMTYEQWLGTYGIRPEKQEIHKPELIRYVKDWSYPSNTINPSDGAPSSAVSWAIAERVDKDRLFREPGFIFGVTVSRPKVYLSRQTCAAVEMLDNAFAWLPAIMRDEVYTSLKSVAPAGDGPLNRQEITDGYTVDLRDLFLYGDQFVNFALTSTDAGLVALPTAGMNRRYPSAADVDALFVTAAGLNLVRQDGVVSMTILGTQIDHT